MVLGIFHDVSHINFCMNPIHCFLDNDECDVLCSPNIFDRIANSDVKIQIINTHEYMFESKASQATVEQFFNYLDTGHLPEINAQNFFEYQQLSNEFDAMKDYLTSDQFNQFRNITNIFNLLSNPNQNNELAEKLISQNLDECIANNPIQLKNVKVTSLFNIFNNSDRVLNDHDKAYHFIIDLASINQEYYSLLVCLDAIKFKNIENLRDSFMNKEDHFGYTPQNIDHFIIVLEQNISDLQHKNHNLQEQNQNLQQNNYYQQKYNNLLEKYKYLRKSAWPFPPGDLNIHTMEEYHKWLDYV